MAAVVQRPAYECQVSPQITAGTANRLAPSPLQTPIAGLRKMQKERIARRAAHDQARRQLRPVEICGSSNMIRRRFCLPSQDSQTTMPSPEGVSLLRRVCNAKSSALRVCRCRRLGGFWPEGSLALKLSSDDFYGDRTDGQTMPR